MHAQSLSTARRSLGSRRSSCAGTRSARASRRLTALWPFSALFLAVSSRVHTATHTKYWCRCLWLCNVRERDAAFSLFAHSRQKLLASSRRAFAGTSRRPTRLPTRSGCHGWCVRPCLSLALSGLFTDFPCGSAAFLSFISLPVYYPFHAFALPFPICSLPFRVVPHTVTAFPRLFTAFPYGPTHVPFPDSFTAL